MTAARRTCIITEAVKRPCFTPGRWLGSGGGSRTQDDALDFYGELLTDKQREYFDLHYNEDLSLAEIAALTGISRQGVWDIIKRAEATLKEIEAKTGLVARFAARREALADIENRLSALLDSPDAAARRISREVIDALRGLDD